VRAGSTLSARRWAASSRSLFALANPERVRRLVLSGAPAGLDRRLPFAVRLMGNPLIGR